MTYELQDRKRTAPIKWAARDRLLNAGWVDLDDIARELGVRVGTLQSKLREFNDCHHVQYGLQLESRRVSGGHWEYRLIERPLGQMPLFEGCYAS